MPAVTPTKSDVTAVVILSPQQQYESEYQRDCRPKLPHLFEILPRHEIEVRNQPYNPDRNQYGGAEPVSARASHEIPPKRIRLR